MPGCDNHSRSNVFLESSNRTHHTLHRWTHSVQQGHLFVRHWMRYNTFTCAVSQHPLTSIEMCDVSSVKQLKTLDLSITRPRMRVARCDAAAAVTSRVTSSVCIRRSARCNTHTRQPTWTQKDNALYTTTPSTTTPVCIRRHVASSASSSSSRRRQW